MVLSDWIGLAWIVGAICFCFASVGTGIVLAEVLGREHAVLWIVGLQCAFQILISFTSAQFVGLTIGGVTFITIAGSLIYPTIELGANYLNEFYGLKISRTSVNAQLVCRVVRHKSAYKPSHHRTGNAGCCGGPVVDLSACFHFLHAELRVRPASGFPCALRFRGP